MIEPLTEREREILQLIAGGLSNQAIANQLVIAASTVKKHINNIYGKLDVQSQVKWRGRLRAKRADSTMSRLVGHEVSGGVAFQAAASSGEMSRMLGG